VWLAGVLVFYGRMGRAVCVWQTEAVCVWPKLCSCGCVHLAGWGSVRQRLGLSAGGLPEMYVRAAGRLGGCVAGLGCLRMAG